MDYSIFSMCLVCDNPAWTWREIYNEVKGDDVEELLCPPHCRQYEFQLMEACKEDEKKH